MFKQRRHLNKFRTMTDRHDIIWFEVLDSTNEEAKRRISDLDNLSVLSALSQTAGRGQRGNTWTAEPGQNLTFSVVMKYRTGHENEDSALPSLKAADQFVISGITALSIVELLETYGIRAKIKWPNDIYVGDRKICGVLIENSLRGSYLSSSIVGIGLNVNQRNFDVLLPNPTSMALLGRKQECLPELLEEFMDIFRRNCREYLIDASDYGTLRNSYLSRLWRLDVMSRFIDYTILPEGHSNGPIVAGLMDSSTGGKEFAGTIRGISAIGNLIVETASGTLREFGFKEIAFIL